MAEDVRLSAEVRSKAGSVEASRLRRAGRVPANLYGFAKPSVSISVSADDVDRLIARGSKVVDIEVDGTVDKAVVQELQWDTFSTRVQHVDLKRVDPDGVATVDVALEIQGEPVGLRDGGQLKQLARTVNITCPDYRIPRTIVVRVGSLKVGDSVVAGALTTDDTITVNTPADTVLVELINPKKSAG